MHQPGFETARLVLRPRIRADLDACVAINSDPEVMRYLGDVWPPERQREHLSRQIDADLGPGLGYWSLFAKAAPSELLGWVLLSPLPQTEYIQLGYRLRRDAWGVGLATEAATEIVAHAFETLRLTRLAAWVHPENLGSQRVLAKLGFADIGAYEVGGRAERLYRRLA
ncbi:GNAT family N-acetyltransferase [Phenylobacterium sp.]|uniref:GNAT family N-acetyltransferase n=1 Tax=Phenylobacterium sp. TaxID=1871053 RepID=UPI0027327F58|nr:GNAT family N-acetyltransferase [Phenylobacterium sp.]MDP3852933.1 GNAT family N-acetyltransferase [Phenylobacterium sp.]